MRGLTPILICSLHSETPQNMCLNSKFARKLGIICVEDPHIWKATEWGRLSQSSRLFLMPIFLEGGVGNLVTANLLLLIILFSLPLRHFGIKVIKTLNPQEKVARDLCSTSQQLINYHQAEMGLKFSVVFFEFSVIQSFVQGLGESSTNC